jgi:flavin reductase (DIM6/NTAB) family NADH-FMN oxidoreductase RutF
MTAVTCSDLLPLSGDAADLRSAFGCFPSGVAAVCALEGDVPTGIAASSFVGVSLDPPLVSLCVQRTSTSWPRLRRASRLGVSVLGEHQQAVCADLAAKDRDRFARVDWQVTEGGAVLVHGSPLWLDCSIHREVDAGDHVLVLLEIHQLRVAAQVTPLVFHASRFHRLAAL